MITSPFVLESAAKRVGIQVPPKNSFYNRADYLHFHVFSNVQFGRSMSSREHWDNAKVISDVPVSKIKSISLKELVDRGLNI